jgi:hypothetical protein
MSRVFWDDKRILVEISEVKTAIKYITNKIILIRRFKGARTGAALKIGSDHWMAQGNSG